MTLAWFDCAAGASGDMFLGALVDAGADLAVLQAAVDAIGVEHVRLSAREVTRAGLAATQVEVRTPRSDVVRTWGNIRGLLEQAELAEPVRARALDVFSRLAHAEATAHRVRPEQVHFHEVGALDAIADVVGSCAGLHALGVSDATASQVAVGSGMVRSEHGLLPVPAPAVLALLAEADAPVLAGPVAGEMCTPTGAAVGGRDHDEIPNVLRIVLGEAVPDSAGGAEAWVLEANVDDLDPRLWPGVLAALLEAGASDAWLTPILMKKGRPAHTLSVLTPPEHRDAVRRIVFTESTSIGLREHRVGKHALERETRTLSVDGVDIRVKVALLDGEVVNVVPEYDDVAAAAARLGRPVKSVLAAATAAANTPTDLPH
jgi:uncharacterized protein (DUF111 family)